MGRWEEWRSSFPRLWCALAAVGGALGVGVPVGGAWAQRVCPPAIKGVIDWRWEPELEAANAAHAQRTEAAKGSERGKVKH